MTEILYRLGNKAFMWLYDNIDAHLKYYEDQDYDFEELLKQKFGENYRIPVDGVNMIETPYLEAPNQQYPHKADRQALNFYKNLEGMTPALASDPRIFAYLNHIHLHKYGT